MAEPGENTMPEFPPRIHVLFAREADTAVILRRGPSKYVCSIGWDRSTNTFTMGQWLKGRIYEFKSDLSPDGKWFMYFALNGRWESETRGSYTAISRAPYLKAVGIWAYGYTYFGGGLFASNDAYWINDSGDHDVLLPPRPESGLRRVGECPVEEGRGDERPRLYSLRLRRDGWRLTDMSSEVKAEKDISPGWVLRQGFYVTPRYQLVNTSSGDTLDFPDWEWADVDSRGIYWAEKGRLFMGQLGRNDLGDIVELYDFHGMTLEPIKAPY